MTTELQKTILDHAVEFTRPMLTAAQSTSALERLLTGMGWNPAAAGLTPTKIQQVFESCKNSIDIIEKLLDEESTDLGTLTAGLAKAVQGLDAVRSIGQSWQLPANSGLPDALPQNFVEDLFFYLFDIHLAQRLPRLQAVLEFCGILTRNLLPAHDLALTDGTVVRRAQPRMRADFELLGRLLSNPTVLLRERYIGEAAEHRTPAAISALVGPAAARLLREYGFLAWYGTPGIEVDTGLSLDERTIGQRLLHLAFIYTPQGVQDLSAQLYAGLAITETNAKLALLVVPLGQLMLDAEVANWKLKLETEGSVQPLLIKGDGMDFLGGADPRLAVRFQADQLPSAPGDPVLRLGGKTGTRFTVGTMHYVVRLAAQTSGIDADLYIAPKDIRLTIARSDGDGFLNKVLPEPPIEIPFESGVGWSNGKGFYFHGSAALEATLPIHKSILGILTVESIYLALRTQKMESGAKDPAIEAVAATTAKVALGPFKANVERIGLRAELAFPSEGGNLGPAHVALGFKPPDGAGLVVDAEAIVGGGYLFYDLEKQEYGGVLQLEVKGGIALKAIGLLSTRMPDGSKGFSLLVIITAEFPPIQLGYGFTLNGVGGLLGVHRTMVVDVLRAGIKNRTLDSILFPKDPVANAQKIISDLRGVFPVASGDFVFGPMAILSWGVPTLLRLELGILIKLPAPVRVALLGTLTMILPEEKAPAVVIHMDVLGVLDFGKGEVSIDATLYDSRIAVFALTGDMALRASWGASPTFALSAGGFNPRFQPPPAFPSLARLALTLATADNPRLRLEAYLALTSNTAQIGARVDLYAEYKVGVTLGIEPFVVEIEETISVQAYLGFDTLIQFSPFGLIADIGALAVGKVGGKPVVQIALDLTLTGPQPWHAWGEATFKFLEVSWRFPFDVTFGPALQEPPPSAPDPLERLRTALADPRNWSAQLPGSGHMIVTLRQMEVAEAEILAHPLGDLTVRQREVPLEVEIARFGSLPLPAQKRYKVEKVKLGMRQLEPREDQQVRDAFAPGQFFKMSDDEKLSLPAFQTLPSGYTRLGVTGIQYPSSATRTATFHYDTVVIDKKDEVVPRHEPVYVLAPALMPVLAERGAAAESPMRQTGSARFAGPGQKVVVEEPTYAVANMEDLAVAVTRKSYIEAETARREMDKDGAAWQVVGAHEVEG